MATTKQSSVVQSRAIDNASKAGIDTWFKKKAEKFESERFAWMTLYLTIQSCLGGVAILYLFQNKASDFMLITSAAVTMTCNAALIAQVSGKWSLLSFYLSIAVNTILILLNI